MVGLENGQSDLNMLHTIGEGSAAATMSDIQHMVLFLVVRGPVMILAGAVSVISATPGFSRLMNRRRQALCIGCPEYVVSVKTGVEAHRSLIFSKAFVRENMFAAGISIDGSRSIHCRN